VSAILRAVIDTKAGGAYSGVITGGNARAVSPAQTLSYAFDVPKNKQDLDVSLTLASDPNNFVDVVLIDPNGELADVGSNLTFDSTGTLSPGLNAQLSTPTRWPVDGIWLWWCRTRSAAPRSPRPSTGRSASTTCRPRQPACPIQRTRY
jgi:hypothetical protein